MRSSYRQSMDFTTGHDQTHRVVHEAIAGDGKAQLEHVSSTTFTANVPVNLSSWGETVTIELNPQDAGTRVSVGSRCVFPLQIVDWGKNRQNVHRILAVIASQLPLTPDD